MIPDTRTVFTDELAGWILDLRWFRAGALAEIEISLW